MSVDRKLAEAPSNFIALGGFLFSIFVVLDVSCGYVLLSLLDITRSILKKISDVVTLGIFVLGTNHLLKRVVDGVGYFFFTEGKVLNLTPPPHTHKASRKNLTPLTKHFKTSNTHPLPARHIHKQH